jgi:hypothetical protein
VRVRVDDAGAGASTGTGGASAAGRYTGRRSIEMPNLFAIEMSNCRKFSEIGRASEFTELPQNAEVILCPQSKTVKTRGREQ